jgi:nucleolar complex protein 3
VTVTETPNQPDVDDRGQAFVDTEELGDYAFLQHLNAKQLGKRVEKTPNRPKEKTIKAKPAPKVESEDVSDEDGLSDAVGDALENSGDGQGKWEDEEQTYELKPRKGGSEWRKKESTRLPVRSTNGKLLPAEDSASGSESESELEESDSDDEVDVEAPNGTRFEEAGNDPTDGPEAIILAKEALAKVAEEIAESPEEKVSPFIIFF